MEFKAKERERSIGEDLRSLEDNMMKEDWSVFPWIGVDVVVAEFEGGRWW